MTEEQELKVAPSEPWVVPSTWAWTRMGDIAEVIGGGTPRTTDYQNYENGDIPWITPADLSGYKAKFIERGARQITDQGLANSSARLMPAGAVLFSSRAPIGYVVVAANPVSTNQGFKSFVLRGEIDPSFVYYYLQRAKDIAVSMASGTTFLEISGAKAALIPFPLAPLAEQRRIVAEIETQLTRLDASVAALKRAQANLKRYRAAVLKAACEGRLVPTEAELARKEGRPAEGVWCLIDQVQHIKTQASKGLRKSKSSMSNASTLLIGGDGAAQNTPVPEGWLLASLEGLTLKIGDVDHRMPKAVTNGIPYVSTKDFQGTEDIDYAGAKKISREDFETLCRKIRPEYGDLLISRYGTIGQVRRVKNSEEFQASYSSAIVKTVNVGTLVDYLVIALRSEPLQAQMMRHVRASSQPDLGLEYIRKLEIPLPPLAEQHRIVEEVERRLSVVEEMEKTVAHGLKRAERLRQAILRKAFAGELVPQDSADEPASVLLERIRAERAANGAGAKRTASRKKVAVGQGVLL